MKCVRWLLLIVVGAALPAFASRTLIDDLGRKVVIPDHPHRIICLVPSVADAVFAVGAGSDVIAVSDFTQYPPEARQKRSIGLPLTPSLELIVSLRPDLVIGSGDFTSNVNQIEQFGIPVFMLNPHGIEGIYRSVLSLGKALSREAAAAAVVARLRARVRAVQARVQGKPVLRVFMLIWHDPITTIGQHAFITELIAAAGGESLTRDLPQEWVHLSFEAIVALAPTSILLVRGSQMSFDDLVRRAEWNAVPAIRQRHVYYVDDRLYSPSPVALDALEDLAKQFHP